MSKLHDSITIDNWHWQCSDCGEIYTSKDDALRCECDEIKEWKSKNDNLAQLLERIDEIWINLHKTKQWNGKKISEVISKIKEAQKILNFCENTEYVLEKKSLLTIYLCYWTWLMFDIIINDTSNLGDKKKLMNDAIQEITHIEGYNKIDWVLKELEEYKKLLNRQKNDT